MKARALEAELNSLLLKGCLEPAPQDPGFYSRMFVVPKVTGGFRPVIDLSTLNKFIRKTHFRMETNSSVLMAIRRGDWMMSLDLKDAYFQIPVHPDSRKYLRFVWNGRPFQFKVLCFGLSPAPQVFTRVMALPSSVLHQKGVRLLRYLDDWLVLSSSEEGAISSRTALLGLCASLNIIVNWDKSELTPSQTLTFLGMDINSRDLVAFPSQKRVASLLAIIKDFLGQDSPPAQDWMVLLGHLSSLSHLVPGGRRRMRSLQFQLSAHWDRRRYESVLPVPISSEVRRDVQWWSFLPNLLQGQSLGTTVPELTLFADASMTGWGASMLDLDHSGIWAEEEAREHISLLELRSIRLGLQAFQSRLQGKTVAVMSDNTTAVSYLQKAGGTRSAALNHEAQKTLQWAEDCSITILTQFVRGRDNILADGLSRTNQVLSTEWTLHHHVCKDLWRLWGYPLLDLFATRLNNRVPNFVSPFPDPSAVATDAFLLPWDLKDLYAFPPFAVLRKVLNKLRSSTGVVLTLIAPFWPQKEWFPDLVDMAITSPRRLPLRKDLLRQPHFHRFHQNLPALQLVAWRLSSDSSVFGVIPETSRERWRNLKDIPPL